MHLAHHGELIFTLSKTDINLPYVVENQTQKTVSCCDFRTTDVSQYLKNVQCRRGAHFKARPEKNRQFLNCTGTIKTGLDRQTCVHTDGEWCNTGGVPEQFFLQLVLRPSALPLALNCSYILLLSTWIILVRDGSERKHCPEKPHNLPLLILPACIKLSYPRLNTWFCTIKLRNYKSGILQVL